MYTTLLDKDVSQTGFHDRKRSTLVFMIGLAMVIALSLVLATADVTHAQACTTPITDQQGANDEPGQKDLTQMCAGSISSGILPISWQWDDTSWSGNNTGDACSLYDTDNDGLANYALCVTVGGNPATQQSNSPRLFSCSDTSPFKCTNPVPVTPNTSSCTVNTTGDDPFNPSNDTLASCSVNLADIGNPGTVDLIEVCSYPSRNPNSDPSDCINYSTGGSAIIVNKVVSPTTDSGLFNLQVLTGTTTSVAGQALDVGNGGTTGRVSVDGTNQTYTVRETQGTNTLLSNYTTTYSCVDDSDRVVKVQTTGTTFTLSNVGNNVDVTCTFTNTLRTGTLTIIKTVVNDNGGIQNSSDFTINPGVIGITPFAGVASPGVTFTLQSGTAFSVTESGPAGYTAAFSGDCVGTIVAGVSKVCTITNNDNPPNLSIAKTADQSTVDAGDQVGYTIVISNTGSGTARNVVVSDNLPAGLTWAESPDVTACSISGGNVLTCNYGEIPSGQSRTVHVVAISSASNCGLLNNTASYTSSNGGSANSNQATITVNCPILHISKTADADTVNAGESIGFTIIVSNTGVGAAKNVTVTDDLPAGFTWVESPDVAACSISSGTLTCNFGTLASNSSVSVHLTASTTAAQCGVVNNSASLDSTNGGTGSASDSVTIECPNVSVVKTAVKSPITAGDVAAFTIKVSNSGPGLATNVLLTDTLPAGVDWNVDNAACSIAGQELACSFPTLANGGEVTLTISGTTDAADCGTLQNDVVISASNEASTALGNNSSSASIEVQCPNLYVEKSADASPISAGDSASFTIVVGNNGAGEARNVVVSDNLPNGVNWSTSTPGCSITAGVLTCNFATLASGAEKTITVSGTTSSANCGLLPNTVSVSASNEAATDLGDNEANATIAVNCAQILITKTAALPSVTAGDRISFTIKVGNAGEGIARTVLVTDVLPNDSGLNWQIDGGSAAGLCSISGGSLHCTIGDLPPLTELSVEISSPTSPESCGTINNEAEVTTINDGSATASDQVVVSCPNVTVVKEALADPINAGETASFRLTVSNIGPGIARSVSLSDPLPTGVAWSVDNLTACSINSGTLSCNFGDLAPNASVQIVVSGVTDAADCGSLSNTATVASSNESSANGNDNQSTDNITVNCPDIEVTKLAVEGTIDAGDVATFTIEVRNSGPGLATNVLLTDTLPTGVTWAEDSNACSINSGTLTCSFGNLASNEVRTVTVSGVTDAQNCGVLDNNVIATAANEQPGDPDNQSAASITVNCPNLSLTKSADDGIVSAGDQVGFTISIFNAGPGNAKNVVVSDQLPNNLSWTIESTNPANSACSINGSQLLTCDFGELASNSTTSVHVIATTQPANCGQLNNQASYSSSNGGNGASNSVSITVNCPNLSINKVADETTINAGEIAGFTISVSNGGPGIARAVTLSDQLPNNLSWSIDPANSSCAIDSNQLLTCNFGDLGDDESRSVHVVAQTSRDSCVQLNNTASYASTNGGTGNSQTATITVNCPNLSVSKVADQSVVSAGDEIGYSITVANAGPGTAKDVVATDTLPAGFSWVEDPNLTECSISGTLLTCNVGSLTSGGEFSVHVSATTTAQNCREISNVAYYDSTNGGSGNSTAANINIQCPNVTVEKVADNASVSAGDTVGYWLTVTNLGPGVAYAVNLTDVLPTNSDLDWTIDGGTGQSQCLINAGTLSCNFGSLAAGISKTVHISSPTTPNSCGIINNSVVVASSNDDQASANASITVHCPSVSVSKQADQDTVNAGDIITFTIVVNKVGDGVARQVILSDTLPTGISWSEDSAACSIVDGVLGCNFGDLSGTTSQTVHVWGTTDADDCGLVSNTAMIEVSNEAADQRGDNTSTDSVSVLCPNIEVSKVADSSPINAGDTASFTIVISNTGAGMAKNVTLSDALPDGITWSENSGDCSIAGGLLSCSFGNLAPGESRTVQVSGSTDAADCGQLINTAVGAASNEATATTSNNSSTATINVNCPNLSVSKVADKSPINAGEIASYTIEVTNNGNGIARNVTLSDTLPVGISWSEDSDDCSISGGLLSCSFGDLASGASRTVHLSGTTDAADCGILTNVAEVKATNEASSDLANNSSTATITVLCPDIRVTKTAVEGTISAGDTASFNITVVNVGLGLATNVTLSDTLPTGIGWTDNSDACSISGNLLSCNFGNLASGDSQSVTVSGATTNANCKTLDNLAEAKATNEAAIDLANNQSSASISVQCADIKITKVADAAAVNAGDSIGYLITVRNDGLGIARSVLVTDTLPTNGGLNWTINGGTAAGQCSIAGGKLTCNLGDMPGGTVKTVHISSPTTPATCGVVDNAVELTTTNADSTQASAQIVVKCPNVNVLKSADKSPVDAGDTISFTLVATNSGTGIARNVTLSDTLPAGIAWSEDSSSCSISGGLLSCNFGDLASGASQTVHVWGVTSAANCGIVENTAEVKANNEATSDLSDNRSTATVTINCPDLSIVKSTNTANVNDGDQVRYTIVVNNSGAGAAKNVVVTDTLPSGLTWSINPANPACSISGGLLTCNFGTISSGEQRSVTVVAITSIKNCGTLSNKAFFSSSNGGKGSSQTVSITVNCPKLTISKVADAAQVNYGTPIAFTIKVKNEGTGPARNVLLTDTLPTGAGISWSIESVTGGATCSITSGTLKCSIATLAPGAEFSVRIVSQTLYACQTLANTATTSASNNPAIKASATISVRCLHPGTIGFWRNWRNKYSDAQMDKLIGYIQVNNAAVYSNTGKLTRPIVDAIYNYGNKTSREQQILGQLTAVKLNLAVTACKGTSGIVHYNDNLCLGGVVNVSGISGAQAFFDLNGNGTVTVEEVVKKVESLWSGKLTINPSDWKFNKVALSNTQKDMIIKVLTGINEGTIVMTSGCTTVLASANSPSDNPSAGEAEKKIFLPIVSSQ